MQRGEGEVQCGVRCFQVADEATSMPGYSGTPLAKKLGIKDDFRVALFHVPQEVKAELSGALAKCRHENIAAKNLDFIFLFAKSRAALDRELFTAAKSLAPAGM